MELRTFTIEDILLGSVLPIDAVELKAKVLALVPRVGDAHDGWWSGRLTVGADGGNDGVLVDFGLEERPYACDYADRHFIYRKERGAQVKMPVVAINLKFIGVQGWSATCCQGQRSRVIRPATLDKSYRPTAHSFLTI